MDRRERIIKELLVGPGTDAKITGRDPAWTGGPEFEQLSAQELSATAKSLLTRGVEEFSEAQELLWASDTYALLVVFQAIDAAGKDSTIRHVMSGVNPQGVQVVSFKQPSSEELDHDYLWRISRALPERAHWDQYMRAYEEAVTATSTLWAPWYVIPADHKPVMQAMVAAILVDTIGSLDLAFPFQCRNTSRATMTSPSIPLTTPAASTVDQPHCWRRA